MTRCIALKRALTSIDSNPALNFWRIQYGCLLDMAVLEWCKLFCSDDEEHQPVHWKNMFPQKDTFRTGLFEHLKIEREEWTDYWKVMKKYRDQHVAHLDSKRRDVSSYPQLDLALLSADFYYSRLVDDLRKHQKSGFPDSLLAYYDVFYGEVLEIAKTAVESTRKINYNV